MFKYPSFAVAFILVMMVLTNQECEAQTKKVTYTYKKIGDLEIKADVYRYDDQRVRPVVAWLHGGALINGHRESVPRWLADACKKRGYILVSFDYRLAPETQLPEIIRDLEDALIWLKEKGPELFHVDPSRVAVAGGSAGGYLTLVTGFRAKPRPVALVSLWGYGDLVGPWYSQPSPHARHHAKKLDSQDAWKQVSGPPISDSRDRKGDGGAFYQYCRQQGLWPKAVSGWDPKLESDKFIPYMPLHNVTTDYSPTLFIHGDEDTDVPFEQSSLMAKELTKQRVPHQLIRIANAEHGLAGADKQVVDNAYARAVEFLSQHLDRRNVQE